MSLQRAKLAPIQTLSATAASVYTNAASAKTYVRSIILHNTNTSAETVVLYNVPANAGAVGTAGATNQFLSISLSANDTLEFSPAYPMVLDGTNDSLQAKTTTAAKVTLQILGDKDV